VASFGLDHEYLCADPMTYLGGCGQKSFQNVGLMRQYSARSCNCGGGTQNSVQMLLDANGPADAIAPVVSITQPADGAAVGPASRYRPARPTTGGDQRAPAGGRRRGGDLNAAPWAFTTDLGLADATRHRGARQRSNNVATATSR
jgi:hypothetical protein